MAAYRKEKCFESIECVIVGEWACNWRGKKKKSIIKITFQLRTCEPNVFNNGPLACACKCVNFATRIIRFAVFIKHLNYVFSFRLFNIFAGTNLAVSEANKKKAEEDK